MHFVLRMLHTQLQRQVRRPESRPPARRAARRRGPLPRLRRERRRPDRHPPRRRPRRHLRPAVPRPARLGLRARSEKIRKGIINLLQSRFLFRLGDHEDAEDAARIAMAVYSTMIRDDPDSRARLRVTPEQILNLPVHYCLASWIAGGTRAASFIGQTFPFPRRDRRRLGAHPPRTPRTTPSARTPRRSPPRSTAHAPPRPTRPPRRAADAPRPPSPRPRAGASADARPTAPPRDGRRPTATPPRRRRDAVRADAHRRRRPTPVERRSQPAAAPRPAPRSSGPHATRAAALEPSPVLRVVGRPARAPTTTSPRGPAPDEPARARLHRPHQRDQAAEHKPPAERLPRLYDERLRDPRPARPRRPRPALADRPRRPARQGPQDRPPPPQQALRARPDRPRRHRPQRPHQRRRPPPVGSTASPATASRPPSNARRPPCTPSANGAPIEQRRAGTLPHDLHALSWAIEFHRVVGELATDYWRTPRYATGRYPVPQIGNGHKRHPITAAELDVPEGHAYLDLPPFREIKPDLSLELRIPEPASSPSTCSSSSTSPAARPTTTTSSAPTTPSSPAGRSPTRATARSAHARSSSSSAATTAARSPAPKKPTGVLTGRIGAMGSRRRDWYFAGREHIFFAAEPDIHHDSLRAFALPPCPPEERQNAGREHRLEIRPIDLLPPTVVRAS